MGTAGDLIQDVLVVTYERTSYRAIAGAEISFGRSALATVRIGADDPLMHRHAGSFRWHDGLWELHNDGSRSALEVVLIGGFEARISAGADPLILPPGASGSVRVLTPHVQILEFVTPPLIRNAPFEEEEDTADETSTVELRDLFGLTRNELRMLVALCEPQLRETRPEYFVVPSAAEVCGRLQISAKQAEDLVDRLTQKLAPHLPGLIGSNAGRAVNRRHRIAIFALTTRCVTARDLRLLTEP
jgi:hypothetical protein